MMDCQGRKKEVEVVQRAEVVGKERFWVFGERVLCVRGKRKEKNFFLFREKNMREIKKKKGGKRKKEKKKKKKGRMQVQRGGKRG